jgi:hypothetical protein
VYGGVWRERVPAFTILSDSSVQPEKTRRARTRLEKISCMKKRHLQEKKEGGEFGKIEQLRLMRREGKTLVIKQVPNITLVYSLYITCIKGIQADKMHTLIKKTYITRVKLAPLYSYSQWWLFSFFHTSKISITVASHQHQGVVKLLLLM